MVLLTFFLIVAVPLEHIHEVSNENLYLEQQQKLNEVEIFTFNYVNPSIITAVFMIEMLIQLNSVSNHSFSLSADLHYLLASGSIHRRSC